jgi:hypothetical protein
MMLGEGYIATNEVDQLIELANVEAFIRIHFGDQVFPRTSRGKRPGHYRSRVKETRWTRVHYLLRW